MSSEIQFNVITPAAPERAAERAPATPGAGEASFAETLGRAVEKLDGAQMQADADAAKVAMGQGNLHEMAISLEKADIAMRLAMKVRNKVVEAYNEIMRMTV